MKLAISLSLVLLAGMLLSAVFSPSIRTSLKGFALSCADKVHSALFGFMVNRGMVACSAPMRSSDFKAIVEPILNEAFDGVYNQRKDEWKQVFTQRTGSKRAYHEEPILYGFSAAPEMPEGMPVTYQQGGVLFNKRYTYRVFGLAYALTKVLIEDGDHIRIGQIYAKHLAQALIETKETLAANMLNRAFNPAYLGGDGSALIGNNHATVGSSYSNVLNTPAALSQTSLEQMLIQIRKAVDNNGKKIRLTPGKLVIGPDNIFQAEVLLKSVLRAGTNNNDINPVKSMGLLDADPVVISRLTSPTAWFITTDAPNGLSLMMRRPLEKSMEGDFETDSVRYKGTERYDVGWTDSRAIFGTPGA